MTIILIKVIKIMLLIIRILILILILIIIQKPKNVDLNKHVKSVCFTYLPFTLDIKLPCIYLLSLKRFFRTYQWCPLPRFQVQFQYLQIKCVGGTTEVRNT